MEENGGGRSVDDVARKGPEEVERVLVFVRSCTLFPAYRNCDWLNDMWDPYNLKASANCSEGKKA